MFKGLRVLLTAGPTYEPIDPVRFIGNRSSGKMGFRLAEVLAEKGAIVDLVTGPVHEQLANNQNINRINVETARQMKEECLKIFPFCHIAILSAAVSDFSPATYSPFKIKKNPDKDTLTIELRKTPDILAELGKLKTPKQLLIGFSLETDNAIENAKKKLATKNLDFIVLNSLADEGAGFAGDTNKIYIINKKGQVTEYTLKSKREVAEDIISYLEDLM